MIDKDGLILDPSIKQRRYTSIEKGPLPSVKALVVHQTDAPTAQATFNGYAAGVNGAHFLIDKDGYEAATPAQNISLQKLVVLLLPLLSVPDTAIYRHPQVSYKNAGEAADAEWK